MTANQFRVTWQLWAVLGGLFFLIFGVLRPAICGEAWKVREMTAGTIKELNESLKRAGIEQAVKDDEPKGFCS